MTIQRGLAISLLALLLAACGGAKSQEGATLVGPSGQRTPTPLPTPAHTPTAAVATEPNTTTPESVAGPGDEVVSLRAEVDAFLTAAEEASALDRIDLFYQHVAGPAAACFTGSMWPDADILELMGFNLVSLDLSLWRESVDAFPEADLIQQARDALDQARDLLPAAQPFRLCLMPTPSFTLPEEAQNSGLNSYIIGDDVAVITCAAGVFCLDRIEIEAVSDYSYAYQVGQTGLNGLETPLLNFAIYQGRAEAFARRLYPDAEFPWTRALTPAQEADLWARMQENLTATYPQRPAGRRINSFLYGGQDRQQYPAWGGIYIGSQIVKAYLEQHPDVSMAELHALTPQELLAASGYAPGQGGNGGESMSGIE